MRKVKNKEDFGKSMRKKVRNYLFLLFLLIAILIYFLATFDIEIEKKGFSIMLSPTEVIFNWIDNSNTESGFIIEGSLNSNFAPGTIFPVCNVGSSAGTGLPVTCSLSLSGLTVGNTYYFRLWAWNSYGNSPEVTASVIIPPQCADTFDNDNDGATDYPADFSCLNALDDNEATPLAQCQDGVDNDGDSLIDYPQDTGCNSAQDNDEYNALLVACGNNIIEQGEGCDDGNVISNDGCSFACVVESGWICAGEPSNCVRTQCNNNLDDDGDTFMDYPADAACANINDNNEGILGATAVCGNNIFENGESCDGTGYSICSSGVACTTLCSCQQQCTLGATLSCTVSGQQGVCATGQQTCVSGSGGNVYGSCTQTVQPTTEVCGNGDEDCDGQTNEGLNCDVAPTGGGGGGGGGTAGTFTWTRTTDLSNTELPQSLVFDLAQRERLKVNISGVNYFVGVKSKSGSKAVVEVSTAPVQSFNLGVGESHVFNIAGGRTLTIKVVELLAGNKFRIELLRVVDFVFKECNDLNDNDQDGRTDLQDAGCSNATDDDESDEVVSETSDDETQEREARRIVFWIVVSVLSLGILTLVALVLRASKIKNRFAELVSKV